jgi:hypothetical protein
MKHRIEPLEAVAAAALAAIAIFGGLAPGLSATGLAAFQASHDVQEAEATFHLSLSYSGTPDASTLDRLQSIGGPAKLSAEALRQALDVELLGYRQAGAGDGLLTIAGPASAVRYFEARSWTVAASGAKFSFGPCESVTLTGVSGNEATVRVEGCRAPESN